MSKLWQNIRVKDQGGLRLTDAGIEFLKDKLRDDKFIDELALTTQISIKGSEPNLWSQRYGYARSNICCKWGN